MKGHKALLVFTLLLHQICTLLQKHIRKVLARCPFGPVQLTAWLLESFSE